MKRSKLEKVTIKLPRLICRNPFWAHGTMQENNPDARKEQQVGWTKCWRSSQEERKAWMRKIIGGSETTAQDTGNS